MAKTKNRKRYTSAQRKAYYMGYGVGLVEHGNVASPEFSSMIDERMGHGQRKDLCDSARKGYFDAKNNQYAPPFSKGCKRYPVSVKEWLKDY